MSIRGFSNTVWRRHVTVKRKLWRLESGYTLLELMMVAILSLIMLAGMVTLVTGAFGIFASGRDLRAVTDSARQALSSMTSQLKGTAYLDDVYEDGTLRTPGCTSSTISFYAEVRRHESSIPYSRQDYGDMLDGELMERVEFSRSSNGITQTMWEHNPPPAGTPPAAVIGPYASSLTFTYYDSAGAVYTAKYKNDNVSRVRIQATFSKGKISRSFTRDVFLRIIDRSYY